MKRVYVNLTDEQAAALKQRAVETGVLQVEQIRRAVDLMLDVCRRTDALSTEPMSTEEYEERKTRTNKCVQTYCDMLLQSAKEGRIDVDAVAGIYDGRRILEMLDRERERRNSLQKKLSTKPSAEQPLFSEQKASA